MDRLAPRGHLRHPRHRPSRSHARQRPRRPRHRAGRKRAQAHDRVLRLALTMQRPSLAHAVLVLSVSSSLSFAQQQNFVAWLIYRGQDELKQSPAIELPTRNGPWRFVRRDGSLIAEMPQPALKTGYSYNFGDCRVDGVWRHDLIAMVRHSK